MISQKCNKAFNWSDFIWTTVNLWTTFYAPDMSYHFHVSRTLPLSLSLLLRLFLGSCLIQMNRFCNIHNKELITPRLLRWNKTNVTLTFFNCRLLFRRNVDPVIGHILLQIYTLIFRQKKNAKITPRCHRLSANLNKQKNAEIRLHSIQTPDTHAPKMCHWLVSLIFGC